MSMMDYMYYGHGGMGFGWIYQLLIFILFVGVMFWILNSNKQNYSNKSALDILNERLAKGEISVKEYKELKKELESQ